MNDLEKAKREAHDHIYEWYIKYNGIYGEKIYEINNNIDKMIVGLSSGSIGLTITFYDSIVDTNLDKCYAYLIKMSWMFFILAIILTLVNNRISIEALSNMKIKLKDGYEKAADQIAKNEMPNFPDISSKLSPIISWLNILSGLAFISGIGFSIIFAWLSF